MPISYKTAFVISFLIHGLVLTMSITLLKPLDFSNFRQTHLIFDIESWPSHINQLSRQLKNFNRSGSHRLEFSHRPLENEFLTISKNENDILMTQEEESIKESYQKGKSKFEQPYLASNFVPNSLKFPRVASAEPKLIPVKMPISERDENTLIKKIKKLAENLHEFGLRDTTMILQNKNQKFEVQIQHYPARTSIELDEVSFNISTEDNGKKLFTHLRVRQLAFSNFAQLIDYWDPQVAVHNDKFEGRFHSNYTFAISRSGGIGPTFHGKVTTAAFDVKTSGNFPIIDQSSIFQGGIETGVKQIRLSNTLSSFFDQSKLNHDEVHHFTEETWLTFQKDGSFTWKSRSSPAMENRKEIQASVFFIIGAQRAKIHVKGVVKGKILVYSGDNIIIDDDLFYANPSDKFSDSDDLLGLVSEKNIEIAHPSITGPGDLHIYAAIYARGWFRIPNFHDNGKSTLHIYGSLSAGSLTATEPRYATHIHFDKRLESQRPPNFPVTEQYEIVEWQKEWEVKEN